MSSAMEFNRSKEALSSFMECLKCRECKTLAKCPVRFINCGHTFCEKCIKDNVDSCGFCGVPIQPNDAQPDFMLQSIIKSSLELYNLIHQKEFDNKDNETSSQNKRKTSKNSAKVTKGKGNGLVDLETKSIASVSKSSKLSLSKESLFTELEDCVTLSKKMIQNLHKPNRKGEVPLHTAAVKNNIKLVRALLEVGADPNTKDNAKLTPLFEAVSYGFYEICELLLQSGALTNIPGPNNKTALHIAAERNRIREAELLIKHGSNINARDEHGKTPKDYSESEEMNEVLANVHDISDEFLHANTSLNATILNATLNSNHTVVLPINLDKDNIELLKTVAVKHKFNIVTSFRNSVTHVLVKTNDNGAVDLSYEICLAILHGTWILMFQWIEFLNEDDSSIVELNVFEVQSIAHSFETPRKARENAQNQNPRLFNNCTFYFALHDKWAHTVGNMQLTKENIIKLAEEGEGKILKRMPKPGDIIDADVVPYHVSDKPDHPLYKCSHYIIYEPGKNEPKLKYNMKTMKALPLIWFIESIEKFQLMDPINYGM